MTEEKGNTVEVRLDASDPFPNNMPVERAILDLIDDNESGTIKVTIEFYPDNADSEVEDE